VVNVTHGIPSKYIVMLNGVPLPRWFSAEIQCNNGEMLPFGQHDIASSLASWPAAILRPRRLQMPRQIGDPVAPHGVEIDQRVVFVKHY
jgi:hypothetical protein